MLRKALFWGLPAVTLMMLVLSLLPASAWHKADSGASYQGFDPNLVFVRERGPGAAADGVVKLSDHQLELTALPSSEPTAHLLTTPLGFKASMDVRVAEQAEGGAPFKIGIWSVRARSGYYIRFGGPPENQIVAQLVSGDEVTKETPLGDYSTGQTYRLEIEVDRKARRIGAHLWTAEVPPLNGNVLRLDGGPADPAYGDVLSDFIPVRGGRVYASGGWAKVVEGSDAYKVSLSWYDAQQRHIGFSQDWRPVKELSGWSRVEFSNTAPPDAAYARLVLGSGNHTSLLFTGLFLSPAGDTGQTLLANGDFGDGLTGWRWATGRREPQLVVRSPLDVTAILEGADAPELFDSVRLSLTASASSSGGISNAVVDNYHVTLPGELWQVVRTDDSKVLLALMLALGCLLCLAQAWCWWRARRRGAAGERLSLPRDRPLTLPGWRFLALVAGGITFYFVANMFLFHYGAQPFDMTSQKVWSYIGAKYGVFDIYPRGSTVSLAKVWNGAPYHEAVFPYPPLMAYYFGFLGNAYRAFFNGPGPISMDTYSLEFLIKTGNLLFGIADAVLIYLIARGMKLGRTASLIPAGVFLFNPALTADIALWGETEAVSLFPLLLSISQAQRGSRAGAWLGLGAAVLTRPQMVVPAALLALVYLKAFGLKESVRPVCWTVVLLYLLLGPFFWHFSPSLLVDYATRVSSTHLLSGGEPALQGVSMSGYSIWPIVTGLLEGVSGKARSLYPEASPLVGGLSYGEMSNLLTAGLLITIAVLIALRPRSSRTLSECLSLVALGVLGWSMLSTGMISRYFIYALALVIACRGSLRTAPYYGIIAVLSISTFVTEYAAIASAIRDVPHLAPLLHSSHNPITRLSMELYTSDWFITAGVLANTLALFWLAVEVIPRGLAGGTGRHTAQRPAEAPGITD